MCGRGKARGQESVLRGVRIYGKPPRKRKFVASMSAGKGFLVSCQWGPARGGAPRAAAPAHTAGKVVRVLRRLGEAAAPSHRGSSFWIRRHGSARFGVGRNVRNGIRERVF
jgi:hypothetical protein